MGKTISMNSSVTVKLDSVSDTTGVWLGAAAGVSELEEDELEKLDELDSEIQDIKDKFQ